LSPRFGSPPGKTKNILADAPAFVNGALGAPDDRYQAEIAVMEWLKKAGALPKKACKQRKVGAPKKDVSDKAYAMN